MKNRIFIGLVVVLAFFVIGPLLFVFALADIALVPVYVLIWVFTGWNFIYGGHEINDPNYLFLVHCGLTLCDKIIVVFKL